MSQRRQAEQSNNHLTAQQTREEKIKNARRVGVVQNPCAICCGVGCGCCLGATCGVLTTPAGPAAAAAAGAGAVAGLAMGYSAGRGLGVDSLYRDYKQTNKDKKLAQERLVKEVKDIEQANALYEKQKKNQLTTAEKDKFGCDNKDFIPDECIGNTPHTLNVGNMKNVEKAPRSVSSNVPKSKPSTGKVLSPSGDNIKIYKNKIYRCRGI